eukprot:1156985-Pelagomonas_calceolata.AAC.4
MPQPSVLCPGSKMMGRLLAAKERKERRRKERKGKERKEGEKKRGKERILSSVKGTCWLRSNSGRAHGAAPKTAAARIVRLLRIESISTLMHVLVCAVCLFPGSNKELAAAEGEVQQAEQQLQGLAPGPAASGAAAMAVDGAEGEEHDEDDLFLWFLSWPGEAWVTAGYKGLLGLQPNVLADRFARLG